MDDGELERCGMNGCKRKISMLDAWAIRDGRRFCSKNCYMEYIKKNDPKYYRILKDRRFE